MDSNNLPIKQYNTIFIKNDNSTAMISLYGKMF
jgi:hypothetical protein